MPSLFSEFQHKNLRLRNRIVMAPMTRGRCTDGIPGEDVAAYYRRRAEGEVGLIITEGVGIRRSGSLNDPGCPHLYGEKAVAGWRRVVAEVHDAGGSIAAQLWHVGARPREGVGTPPLGLPESPSGLAWPGKVSALPWTRP